MTYPLLYAIAGAAALGVIALVGIYNAFVRRRTHVEEAWSDIEVQLKRRYNLIPNIVETVKGYAAHEQGVFEKVTRARTEAMGVHTAGEHAHAENMLSGALKSLFAVAESYPDLKANVNFLELQRELADAENKIQAARRFYNSTVRDLNIMIQSFPSNIIARLFGFAAKEFFDLEDGSPAHEPVAVKF